VYGLKKRGAARAYGLKTARYKYKALNPHETGFADHMGHFWAHIARKRKPGQTADRDVAPRALRDLQIFVSENYNQ
jgi:hypothetical protein